MRQTKRMTIPVTRREKERHDYPNGSWSESWKSIPDGSLTGNVVIEIDVDAILALYGERALRNRTKRAIACHGYIIARASGLVREGAAMKAIQGGPPA